MRLIDANALKKEIWGDYYTNDMFYPNYHEDAIRIVSNIIDAMPTIDVQPHNNDEWRTQTLNEFVSQKPCDCWHQEYGKTVCWGTKEREECSCEGDPAKCNFYPDKRRKWTWQNQSTAQ